MRPSDRIMELESRYHTQWPRTVSIAIIQYLDEQAEKAIWPQGKNDMKIEQKNSLWRVYITSGCYSDREEDVIVVRANSVEEAKNSVKVYFSEKENGSSWNSAWIIFEDWEKYQYQVWDKVREFKDDDMDWDTDYWDAKDIKISKLDIIYTEDKIAKKSLQTIF